MTVLNFSHSDINVIIVDDEEAELQAYSFLLRSMGVKQITPIKDSRKIMPVLENHHSCVMFLDLNMPYKSGQQVLAEVREKHPQIPVIICTANSDIEMAVECLKSGAHDYLVKPITNNTFGSALRNALEIVTLRNEVLSLKGLPFSGRLQSPEHFAGIITQSPAMLGIFRYIESIASTGQPVLILGETGSGKEMISRAIHDVSKAGGRFVAVDVSGLDETLFSDALFGHRKGAFTGADADRPGLIEKAADGTIFLDEIGDLTLPSQVKLLRLLQEGIYYPLGDDHPRQCRARIITATNKELNRLAGNENEFRLDFYYRLSTHLISLPPLRERKEDLSILIHHFTDQAAQTMGKTITAVSPKLVSILSRHSFPGNIRELKTYIYDAVAQCSGPELAETAIVERLSHETAIPAPAVPAAETDVLESFFGYFPTIAEMTDFTIDLSLEKTGHNQTQAAKLLGISKQALNKRLQKRNSQS